MYRLWMDAGHCQTRPSWRLQHPAVPPRAARGPERGHLGPAANALLNEGRKGNEVDARKPAEPLRTGMLRPVYHGENGLRTLRELGRSDQTSRFDASDESTEGAVSRWRIPYAGTQVYAARCREKWLSKIPQAGVRRRASNECNRCSQQLTSFSPPTQSLLNVAVHLRLFADHVRGGRDCAGSRARRRSRRCNFP